MNGKKSVKAPISYNYYFSLYLPVFQLINIFAITVNGKFI